MPPVYETPFVADVPDVMYAKSGGVAVAYQVAGDGPQDLVFLPFLSNPYSLWQLPLFAAGGQAARGVVAADPRQHARDGALRPAARPDDRDADGRRARGNGRRSGASARRCSAGPRRATPASSSRATYPERVARLILYRRMRAARARTTIPGRRRPRRRCADRCRAGAVRRPGVPRGVRASELNPQWADDAGYLDWFVWSHRLSSSPAAYAEFRRMTHRHGRQRRAASGPRPDARALEGATCANGRGYVGEPDPERDATCVLPGVGFVAARERRRAGGDRVVPARRGSRSRYPTTVLATLLFTDLVGSTQLAAEIGDVAGAGLLEEHMPRPARALSLRRRSSSTRRATASSRASTARRARSRCARAIVSGDAGARPGRACRASTRVSASASAASSRGSPSASARESSAAAGRGRGARLGDGARPRRRLGLRLRGSRRARAEGRAGVVAPVAGGSVTVVTDALIVDAVRSPIGRRNGSLAGTRGDELAGQVLNGLVARHDLDPAEVEDVQMGCVTQIGEQGWNIGRMAPMVAGWPETVCGTTVDRQCGSSMQTNFNAAAAIWAGQLDVVVSAGVEMMSRVPMGSNGGDLSDKLTERWQIVPQGISAEAVASEWNLSREALDATRSSRTAARSRRATRAASRTRSCPSRWEPRARPSSSPSTRRRGATPRPRSSPRCSPRSCRTASSRPGTRARSSTAPPRCS